jgi:hypothetical protein
MKRESGFYWIIRTKGNVWMIAYWVSNLEIWILPGTEDSANVVYKINENRLICPSDS